MALRERDYAESKWQKQRKLCDRYQKQICDGDHAGTGDGNVSIFEIIDEIYEDEPVGARVKVGSDMYEIQGWSNIPDFYEASWINDKLDRLAKVYRSVCKDAEALRAQVEPKT